MRGGRTRVSQYVQRISAQSGVVISSVQYLVVAGGGGGGSIDRAGGGGGAGGSGIVIIRYPAGMSLAGAGGTITTDGGYRVHTFTSTGTFSFVV